MAGRIRTIKPEVLDDEIAAAQGHLAWRLWISSWVLADDQGCFRANPNYLLGQAFWAVSVGAEELRAAMRLLATCKEHLANDSRDSRERGEHGLWLLYRVRGQPYGWITGWQKHQRVDKPGKPRCPGPETAEEFTTYENSQPSRDLFANDSREIPGTPAPDLRPPTTTTTTTNDQRPQARRAPREVAVSKEQIQIVWGVYRKHHPRTAATLDSKRKDYKKIRDRLREGFGVEQLADCIDGYHRSPFHQGHNDRGTKFLGLELMMRDSGHVEQGIAFDDDPDLGRQKDFRDTPEYKAMLDALPDDDEDTE